MAAATATEIVILQTGILNGNTDSAGAIDNTPYYAQWAYGLNRLELVNQLTGQISKTFDLLPTTVAALAQADLALAPYTTDAIGKSYMVTDWNATGFGVIIQKVSDATNDFNDWRVVSTGTKASTGDVGQKPL